MFKSKRYAKETILPTSMNYLTDGIQRIYKFEDTGWGASVIMRKTSYGGKKGLWEIAPQYLGNFLHWEHALELGLYDTKGYLNDAQLQDELHKIKRYSERGLYMRIQKATRSLFNK